METGTTDNKTAPRSFPEFISDEFVSELHNAGVVEAFVFGSIVDSTATDASDIDLLVRFNPEVSLFDQFDLADRLSGIAGRKVDLLTRINPFFVEYIEPTLVPLSMRSRQQSPIWGKFARPSTR